MDVPHETYERLEKYISRDESPVGIDAIKNAYPDSPQVNID